MIGLAAWLLLLPLRVALRLGVRGTTAVVCLLVLAVSLFGAAVDLGLYPPPADASPRRKPARPTPPSSTATADVPRGYLLLYRQAGRRYHVPWAVLAGVGKVESDHGRSPAPGVRSGVNRHGCCAGPMQFNLRNGPPSTWATYGRGNVYDPADAIPAAARLLAANGAPRRLDAALYAYNHSWPYVALVKRWAARYGATRR
jgi:hypothetical protein